MKKTGLSLIELLVVVVSIALVMGILIPVLAKVKLISCRRACESNLSHIFKAMLVYTDDWDEPFPLAGGKRISSSAPWCVNGIISNWQGNTWQDAYGSDEGVTITSCFYLLVKYANVVPKTFVCRGDKGAKEFKLSEQKDCTLRDITEAWDFGNNPSTYCSYAYQYPFSGYGARSISAKGTPVLADRNPYYDDNARGAGNSSLRGKMYLDGGDGQDGVRFWDTAGQKYADPDKTGNTAAHRRSGQNVAFVDGHVKFVKTVNVGIDNDNIYTPWPVAEAAQAQREIGIINARGWDCGTINMPSLPIDKQKDAFLVSESQSVGKTGE